PAEDWLVLTRPECEQLGPDGGGAVGAAWDIDAELTAKLLICFYPQTENNKLASNRIDRQSLRGTVLGRENGLLRVRLDGKLRMKHQFYPDREDNKFVDATLVGFLDYDLHAKDLP